MVVNVTDGAQSGLSGFELAVLCEDPGAQIRSRARGVAYAADMPGLLRRKSDITQEYRIMIVRLGESLKSCAHDDRAKRGAPLLQLTFSLGMHMCARLMLKRQFSTLYC
jgi:hypothetical protein